MIGDEAICARTSCDTAFVKGTHNQKYCCNECCRLETNRKIMEKYHAKAAIRRGKKRGCNSCGNPLSRYNEDDICGPCQTEKKTAHNGEAQELLASVSWL